MAAIRQSRPARAVPATPYPPEWSITLTSHGASGTPPPTDGLKVEFRPRRGQSGRGAKGVKKNAALLRFLAFGAFDHLFGVLRGERLAAKTMAASLLRKPACAVIRPAGANIARSPVSPRSTVAPCSQPRNPLGRASRAFASSGHLFRFLFGCLKRKALMEVCHYKRASPHGGDARMAAYLSK